MAEKRLVEVAASSYFGIFLIQKKFIFASHTIQLRQRAPS